MAACFSGEPWALALRGKVGTLVTSVNHGSWLVLFPGRPGLVECATGLMGRFHLVYAEVRSLPPPFPMRRW